MKTLPLKNALWQSHAFNNMKESHHTEYLSPISYDHQFYIIRKQMKNVCGLPRDIWRIILLYVSHEDLLRSLFFVSSGCSLLVFDVLKRYAVDMLRFLRDVICPNTDYFGDDFYPERMRRLGVEEEKWVCLLYREMRYLVESGRKDIHPICFSLSNSYRREGVCYDIHCERDFKKGETKVHGVSHCTGFSYCFIIDTDISGIK
eukprot:TRINITY_DN5414_c0_g1_i1.p1 TRINITY_DN5414_c0_g1~~TRINITY_DN5414_c0_g1_i1.p1  ORF type:complete len:227 (+),score=35.43 TRINITY_DN5414_c0_g1_i1:75-683(+)